MTVGDPAGGVDLVISVSDGATTGARPSSAVGMTQLCLAASDVVHHSRVMTELHRLLPDRPVASLADHVRAGGHGLAVARQLAPAELVALIAESGLRGRGGAGFPTGVKWRTIGEFSSPNQPTPVVVNAAEGEPGTFKDRLLIRRNPYRIIEGALIAARAIGSPRIIVASKAAFTLEIAALQRAIAEFADAGWLDGVTVHIVPGPSEYLFGEETGLLEVIEGRPPFPRVTPPWRRGIDPAHPENAHSAADVQLATRDGSPSAPALVDNVETLANVPLIVEHGVAWFREAGTDDSPGTMLCTVTGATQRHGVGEFALGTPVGEVIETVGGGPRRDHELRAVLSGVANPPLRAELLDTALTYEDLAAAGSGLGSASFIVVDDSVSMRWVAAGVARFLGIESCGQCEPCKRDGLAIAATLADDEAVDDNRLADRLATVTRGARCALAGQTQRVVAGIIELDPSSGDEVTTAPNEEDADLMAIVPLVDIVDGRAVLDLSHRSKAADWTYSDETQSRPVWPIQRLADQPVRIHPAHVPERQVRQPVVVEALDPMAVITALDGELRRAIDSLESASPDERDAARAELRVELHRHLDLLESLVFPLLDRVRDDGADISRYPDEHARRAHALVSAGNPGDDDSAAIEHARRAVDEVQSRIVPLLRNELDDRHRRLLASALAAEAGRLGIDTPAISIADAAR